MAAYIEPRLIHLLNDPTRNMPVIPKPWPFPRKAKAVILDASVALPPLDPEAAQHREPIPPLSTIAEAAGPAYGREPSNATDANGIAANKRKVAVSTSTIPINTSSASRGTPAEPHSHTHIATSAYLFLLEPQRDDMLSHYDLARATLVDDPFSNSKKRPRGANGKDDFVQLPQPLKKHRATQQNVVPPIINGLVEPPIGAAMLPPMISGSFGDDMLGGLGCAHRELIGEYFMNSGTAYRDLGDYAGGGRSGSTSGSCDCSASSNSSNSNESAIVIPWLSGDRNGPATLSDERVFLDPPSSPPPLLAAVDVVATPAAPESATANLTAVSSSPHNGSKRRVGKPRRKWSDQETNHLLLGVSRHGVGKWTTILEDPEYQFDERTAGDLKDRFRTCCPNELREMLVGTKTSSSYRRPQEIQQQQARAQHESEAPSKSGKRYDLDTILHRIVDKPSDSGNGDVMGSIPPASALENCDEPAKKSTATATITRAHRKNMDDLAELGIKVPFKKSGRRERRAFCDEDDRQILEGLECYGPLWTKIQRDPRFNLSDRQPTDLRDRVRNKYPKVYARIEKGAYSGKESGKAASARMASVGQGWVQSKEQGASSARYAKEGLTQIVTQPADDAAAPASPRRDFYLDPQLVRVGSREDLRSANWALSSILTEQSESLHNLYVSSMDVGPLSGLSRGTGTTVSEMGIARLLLHDADASVSFGGPAV